MKKLITLIAVLTATPALAGGADVVGAQATRTGDTWRIDATVLHADTGWDHYANAFEVLGPDGAVLGTRVLYHPHVNEQPFTRSLGGVAIPEGSAFVTVRAVDSVHGISGQEFRLDLQ